MGFRACFLPFFRVVGNSTSWGVHLSVAFPRRFSVPISAAVDFGSVVSRGFHRRSVFVRSSFVTRTPSGVTNSLSALRSNPLLPFGPSSCLRFQKGSKGGCWSAIRARINHRVRVSLTVPAKGTSGEVPRWDVFGGARLLPHPRPVRDASASPEDRDGACLRYVGFGVELSVVAPPKGATRLLGIRRLLPRSTP